MPKEKLRISNTRVSVFLHCRQKYVWEYIENLTPKTKSRPLKLGDIVHQLLHSYYLGELTLEGVQDPETLVRIVTASYPDDEPEAVLSIALEASVLVSGYLHKFTDDTLQIIPGETMLEVERPNYILIGRIDAWARTDDQRLWRIEHKTAARADANYLGGLKSGLQGALYDFLTEQLFNESISGTVYNLLVKTKKPDFHRVYTRCDRGAIERMLKTIDGVWRDMSRGDFYPSSKCFSFNNPCPFKVLCEHDSPGAREAFFTRRKEGTPDEAQVSASDIE